MKPFHYAKWTVGLVLLLISTWTSAQSLDSKIPFDTKTKVGTLPNGLTYYIRENKKPENKVELRLVVNAGSVLEDDDQRGLAHMAEHMAFNGTKNFKKNEIVSFLQDIGVGFGSDLNAYTSFDETVYMLPIPTDKPGNLEKGFQVLEDWAHNVTYLDDDIQGERAIILEESRLGKGANDRMYKKIYPKLLAGSRYAERLPIGLDSIISNFKYDVIRRYYRDWYRPDLMAVIVVGDIEAAKAEQLIKKHFSNLKSPDQPRPRTVEKLPPYADSEGIVVTDKEATSYVVSINYPAEFDAPAGTLADYREDLVKSIFTSMLNLRLQELTQQQNPPFNFAGVSFDSYARNHEAFSAYASAGTGDVRKALGALTEEIERVKRYGFTEAELDRAKKNMISYYERVYNNRDKTESENYVEEYIRHFLEKEPSPGIEKEFEYVKQLMPGIKLEELNKVAGELKEEKNKFVYVTGPESDSSRVPDSNELLAIMDSREKADIKPYEEKLVSTKLMEAEPRAGRIIGRVKNATLGTTELKLSNGVSVTLKPTDFKADQIIVTASRPGGKNHYGVKDKYSAEYATAIVGAMGVGEFSPTDLKKALAGKTANVNPSFTAVSEGLQGSTVAKDMETLFQLIHLYFTKPRKDTALFNSFVQRNKSQFAMLSANPQAAFVDTMYNVLFNNNPLAPVAVPKSAYFDKIELDRALAIYKERFGNAHGMNFVITGSFDESKVIPLVEKYIGSLPASPKKFVAIDNKVRPITGKKYLTVNRGKEQKSLILSFFSGEVPYSEELALKMQVLSEVLNIRIIEELREKVQGIYGGGTFAELEKVPYPNFSFVLQLPSGPEKVDTLLTVINREFDDIMSKGPDPSYLDKVKKQMLEQHKIRIKDNFAWANQLIDIKTQNANADRFLNFEKYLNKITAKDIQQVAKMVLGSKNQFTAVLMPEGYKSPAGDFKAF